MKRAVDNITRGLGVYVHWPYCAALCSYCDFNKYLWRSNSASTEQLQQAYLTELSYFLSKSPREEVASIYFGGGTPSLASASLIYNIINEIKRLKPIASDAEVIRVAWESKLRGSAWDSWPPPYQITLEGNPNSLSWERMQAFKSAGINRLSVCFVFEYFIYIYAYVYIYIYAYIQCM